MQRMNLMMLAVLMTSFQVASAEEAAKHPIRQEIVDEIKLKATTWKPKEVSENHMRHRSVESIKGSMGHLGTSQASVGADVFKSVTESAIDVFRNIRSTVTGRKEEVHRVKQASPTSDANENKYDLPV